MGYYPGDDEEKAERARQRERERQEKERTAKTGAREARQRERAERLAAARAAWDEAGGGEQTHLLLEWAARIVGRMARRARRWTVRPGGPLRDGEGEVRPWVVMAAVPSFVAVAIGGLYLVVHQVEQSRIAHDAPKCRAVFEQIAIAPNDLTYRKAQTLLSELHCSHDAVPDPDRIAELMGDTRKRDGSTRRTVD